MPPKSSSDSKPIGLRFGHFESNSRGKVVERKRKRSGPVKESQTIRIKPVEGRSLPTSSSAISVPPAYIDFTDDAGDEIFEHQTGDSFESHKTTANEYLKAWWHKESQSYLDALYAQNSAPQPDDRCSHCDSQTSAFYRCKSCLDCSPMCLTCLKTSHKRHPLHHFMAWNGSFWEETSLSKIKMVLNLGHQGKACPHARGSTLIWVGDVTGFLHLPVSYCCHQGAPSHAIQLLQNGLFPCSHKDPQSAFTLSLLEHFSVFSTMGKTSAHRYYSVLKRFTSTGFPSKVADRYRELLQTHRKYAYLMSLKRTGTGFPPHPNKAYKDTLAIQCVACPHPGINFIPIDVLAVEIFFFIFWFSYDGNFRNPRKAKKFALDDICFTDGKMYFVLQRQYQEWIKSHTNQEPSMVRDRPDCDNHKAATDKYLRWGGLDVTGVGACTCARHSFFLPLGIVDFHNGERFANGDYAIASTITNLLRNGHLAFGMTYDIWCHWIPKLKERARNFPSHIALPGNLELTGGIPKFHLQGHNEKCRVLHSLNYKPYVGRIEGEGCERAWAFLNETSGSTSEKSPGARWDSINYILNDWNFEKMVQMGSFLAGKFVEAKKMHPRQRIIFEELDQSLPPEMTSKWRGISIEPVQSANGKWASPFFSVRDWGRTLQEAINDEQRKEKSSQSESTTHEGVTKWLSKGIELEHTMDKLRVDAMELNAHSTPRQHNLINDRRKILNERITAHRQERERFLGALGDPDHPNRLIVSSPDPENAELGLPSSYKANSLIEGGCSKPREVEGELRRAVCNDALQTIRNLLGAKSFAISYKRKNVVGEMVTTRAESALRDLQSKVDRAHRRYNRSRSALIRLDVLESDRETYQDLKKDHLKMLPTYLDHDSSGIGQGAQAIPWIWRSKAVANSEEWQIDALKVEWFRTRQRYVQWEEELKILKREMTMTLKGFQCRQEIWKWKSSQGGLAPGMAEYAAQKSNFFKKLSEEVFSQCNEHVKDPIVTLQWAASQWPQNISLV